MNKNTDVALLKVAEKMQAEIERLRAEVADAYFTLALLAFACACRCWELAHPITAVASAVGMVMCVAISIKYRMRQ